MNYKVLHHFAHWVLPQGVVRWVEIQRRSAARISDRHRSILKKNTACRNVHQNQRCFVLATGPSIKEQNLAGLEKEVCIAVSNFYLHPDFKIIQPAYYCLVPWHPPHDPQNCVQLVDQVLAQSDTSRIYLGLSDFERTQDLYQQNASRLLYLNLCQSADTMVGKRIDLTTHLIAPQSVTIMALQVAIYMGFKEIYLLGVDHNAILNTSGQHANTHFYAESKALLKTDIGYFKDELASYLTLWRQYECLNDIAQAQGTQIFNATPGSLLDVFERKSLETVLGIFVEA
jgi:hypothetical protein